MRARVLIAGLIACFGCGSSSSPSSPPPPAPPPTSSQDAAPPTPHRYLYAAFSDGTVHVYDVDAGHAEVTSFATVTGVVDVRGACATASGIFYFSHARPEGGYVVAVDVRKDAVVWSHEYQPNVDRLACAAGGAKLYVPSNEADNDDELIVVDAPTGNELSRIPISPRVHDCVANLAGTRVYVETKSSNLIAVVDTTHDAVATVLGPFAGIGGPLTIDGRETSVFGNFFGVNGFQVGDIQADRVAATVSIPGQTAVPGELDQHGIAIDPGETEVWVNDGVGNRPVVHVFDATASPPAPKVDVTVDFTGPHWVSFSIAGDYAYVAGPKGGGKNTDVIDPRSHQKVGTVGPSEDMVEIDWAGDTITAVGNQFGVGRRQ